MLSIVLTAAYEFIHLILKAKAGSAIFPTILANIENQSTENLKDLPEVMIEIKKRQIQSQESHT